MHSCYLIKIEFINTPGSEVVIVLTVIDNNDITSPNTNPPIISVPSVITMCTNGFGIDIDYIIVSDFR